MIVGYQGLRDPRKGLYNELQKSIVLPSGKEVWRHFDYQLVKQMLIGFIMKINNDGSKGFCQIKEYYLIKSPLDGNKNSPERPNDLLQALVSLSLLVGELE